ncbi:MAG: MotA/TolQ/ExbB proton channel family protein [Opitutales bacterium]|nr:MotA/TolQ/ExbB proton channel family protein [Opitutales bacterium]
MLELFNNEVWPIWLAGGPLMIPLAFLGLLIYLALFELHFYLSKRDFYKRDPNKWGHWIDMPKEATGELGNIIQYSQDEVSSAADIRDRFDEIRRAYLPKIRARIRFANILIGAAPLTGLLGTVMGMLNTFVGLSVSTAGNTIDLVAGGISEALITTQTGLVLAIPAYVIVSNLRKRAEELSTFLIRLETLTVLRFQRRVNLAKRAAEAASA